LLIALSLLLLAVGSSCEKSEANGTVLVSVLHDNEPLAQATVLLQSDTAGGKAPVLISSKRCDAEGEAYFDHLNPGYYYISASGYVAAHDTIVSGSLHLQVYPRKGQNYNTAVVTTQP
jgi:hypothetical protein